MTNQHPPLSELLPFAAKLKHAREVRNLSVTQAAKLCGLQQSNWTHFEKGYREPNLKNLRHICLCLCIRADELLDLPFGDC